MAAGIKILEALKRPGVYEQIAATTERLADGLRQVFAEAEVPAQVNSVCGAFTVFFNADPVTDMAGAAGSDSKAFAKFFHAMTERGIYPPPSQFEAWFISTAHTAEDVDKTLAAAREALRA
jgi:glutamate-1-semialdehyde 2,1-aminomutase